MKDIRYLLSIKELLDDSAKENLLEMAYEKLDKERLKKAKKITHERRRAESIAAGLLLQFGLQQFGNAKAEEAIRTEGAETEEVQVQLLTISQVLAKLGEPINIEYDYSEKGKPAFHNFPWHFNLSHSEEYVFLVLSKQEVGVDIQYKRSFYNERILRRFFTKEEQKLWAACETAEDKEEFFYRMWIRKEAYGKLTGEGIGNAVSKNVTEETELSRLGVVFEHYDLLPDYHMVVCKWAEEKE